MDITTNTPHETEIKTYSGRQIRAILKKPTLVTVTTDTQGTTESVVNNHVRHHSETTLVSVVHLKSPWRTPRSPLVLFGQKFVDLPHTTVVIMTVSPNYGSKDLLCLPTTVVTTTYSLLTEVRGPTTCICGHLHPPRLDKGPGVYCRCPRPSPPSSSTPLGKPTSPPYVSVAATTRPTQLGVRRSGTRGPGHHQ